MHTSEIPFRLGLVTCAFLLLLMFTSSIFEGGSYDIEEELEHIAEKMDLAARYLIQQGDGSSLVFSRDNGQGGLTFRVPDVLMGKQLELRIGCGLCFIERGRDRVVFFEGIEICPSMPITDRERVNTTRFRGIARDCGGFVLDHKTGFKAVVEVLSDGVGLHIFPTEWGAEHGECTRTALRIRDFLDNTTLPVKGWSESLCVVMGTTTYITPGAILVGSVNEGILDGWCPLPVLIPEDSTIAVRNGGWLEAGDDLFLHMAARYDEEGRITIGLGLFQV